jgi:hypothetical protein
MNVFHSTVSVERVKELLSYNPETGIFTWRVARNNKTPAGAVAGTASTFWHRQLRVDFKSILAHRAAWAVTYGEWPIADIDHINGDPSDNRIVNLRMVTRGHNLQNQRKAHADSKSGLLGVKQVGNKWDAKIMAAGVLHRLGIFLTPEEASAAYLEAKRKLHPGCTI